MKKIVLIITGILIAMSSTLAQPAANSSIPMIGDDAPSFTAESTTGTLNFPVDYGKKWKIVFAHPADFTPVCTTELLELAELQDDFDELGVKLVVLSTDALETHNEWKKSMESLNYKGRTTPKIKFPLVADQDKQISREYGMIHPSTNSSKNVRGVYYIDPDNKIRAMVFYPMNIGRNTAEIKRTLVALQTADSKNVLTPADWKPGDDVLVPYTKSSSTDNTKPSDPNIYQVSWYLTLKKIQ